MFISASLYKCIDSKYCTYNNYKLPKSQQKKSDHFVSWITQSSTNWVFSEKSSSTRLDMDLQVNSDSSPSVEKYKPFLIFRWVSCWRVWVIEIKTVKGAPQNRHILVVEQIMPFKTSCYCSSSAKVGTSLIYWYLITVVMFMLLNYPNMCMHTPIRLKYVN